VLIFTTEADKQDPILASYLANYNKIAEDDLAEPILDLSYVEKQAANMLRYVGEVSGVDAIDLGCGRGILTRKLVEAGARNVVAVDISMNYLQRLSGLPQIIPVQANAEILPFREGFDLLTATDVMEHVLNLGSFLVSINKCLKMGGRCVIRVPLREDLIPYSSQAGCKYRFVHLRTFDLPALRLSLSNAGFAVAKSHVDGFGVYSPQPFWTNGPRRKNAYIKMQSWLLRRMPHASTVTTWHPRFASLFMKPQEIVVVARKVRNLPY